MRSKVQRAKSRAARVYFIFLVTAIVLLFDVVAAIVLFTFLVLANYVYVFLKYVMLFGSLNEDLREINN